MQPRPLITDNRILRLTSADDLRVSLGRAVTEMAETPMTGALINRSFKQAQAASRALTETQREEFAQAERERRSRQSAIEYNLDNETDPSKRENLLSQLDGIYQEKDTQKDAIFQQAIDEGRLQTPEDLTEKYGDLLEFDEMMTDEEARLLYQGKKEEVIRNAIISRSPTGFVAGAAKFGGGMLAMATDPVEVATMFIPFVGQAGKAASVARFGRIGGRARVGAIEGTAGALLTEPLYYGLSKDQQLDYTMSEALLNVGAGFFLGGAIGTVAGMLTRTDVDAAAIINSVEVDAAVRTDLEAVELPPRISEAEAFARADRVIKQTRDMYAPTGGRVTYETAIRQLVTDQGVNVSMVLPRTVKRPQTLSEFIRDRGGINDQDATFRGELSNLGIEGRAGYINNKNNMVNGISNRTTETNLDDMAEMAFEAGYIPERDTNLLVDALSEETRGNFTFAQRDMNQAEMWRQFSAAKNDLEAEISQRDGIRSELEGKNIKDLSDDEIALISERMARTGDEAEDAWLQSSIAADEVRAEMSARHGLDIENDPLADFDAAARFDTVGDDIEMDDTILREEAIIAQMREDGDLTPDQIKELDEIKEIDAAVQAYIEVTEAATVCMARA
jgi:hypothetical protein|tara:strand:- start:3584 stop:5440 length:1857 start_codon:yes stop_codon:yes gene_type:complete